MAFYGGTHLRAVGGCMRDLEHEVEDERSHDRMTDRVLARDPNPKCLS